MGNIFTFREISEKDELEKFFQLRFQVCSDSQLAPFLSKNDHQVDIDIYDLHARLFGLFCDNNLVGGIRLVLDKKELYIPEVYEIGHKYGIFGADVDSKEKLEKTDYPEFPFLSYQRVPKQMISFYQKNKNNKKICAASRCVITNSHRGLKTIQFLTESIITVGNLYCGKKTGLGFADVNLSHSKFYCRYGFAPIENEPVYFVHEVPAVTLTISLSTSLTSSSIPQHLHSKLEEMIHEYSSTNRISRTL
jgi:hypothetical protein